jgi:catechol 2,3-dioxygenase-like lactoylglutathione lyase family enzyme
MLVRELESILFYVSDLTAARRFYVEPLGLPILFEDAIVIVLRAGPGRQARAVQRCASTWILMHAKQRLSNAGSRWFGKHRKHPGAGSR